MHHVLFQVGRRLDRPDVAEQPRHFLFESREAGGLSSILLRIWRVHLGTAQADSRRVNCCRAVWSRDFTVFTGTPIATLISS